jgi:predicted metal-dependent phosphoesterase TrpH
MAQRLRELGFQLDDAGFAHREAPGRPHLADAVMSHPANAERLREEGRDDVSPFIEAYLIPGRPGFRPRTMPTVEEAIGVIHAAGGVAVWAHPFWDVKDPKEVLATIDRYVSYGLDGIEAFYVAHTPEQTALVADRAQELDLLTTGSADYHGPDHRHFSKFRDFDLCGRAPRLGPIDVR